MKPFVSSLKSEPATTDNTLVYLLWILGGVGTAGVALMGKHILPIVDRDFTQLWVAGKLAASGHVAQVYDMSSLSNAATALTGTKNKNAFPYPPHMLLLAVPLSFLPLKIGFFVWQLVSALLFSVAAKPYLPRGMPVLLAVLTPSALVSVIFGQNGLFFGAMWLFAFSGSALAAALLTMKPHIGFLVAIEMIRRKLVIRTALIGVAVAMVSAIVFGWKAWLLSAGHAASGVFSMVGSGKFPNVYVQMTTPYIGYGYLGWIAFAVAAIYLLTRRFDVFTAATATFLISPYGFHYDMTVVCLGFGILLFRSWRSMPAWQTLVCALTFLSPIIVRLGTWLVPPLLLMGLYILSEIETEPRRLHGHGS